MKLSGLRLYWLFLIVMLLTACQSAVVEDTYIVSLVADGRERTFEYNVQVTVEEFLQRAEVELGERDRISPPLFTQISDGMRVTLVRVAEEVECIEEEIPYERRVVPNEGLSPDEERLAQSGLNGVQEICYRITIEDGIQADRSQTGQPTVLQEPQDEIIFIGPDQEPEPIPIEGTLSYINNGNAWVIQNSSLNKRPITTTGDLDSLVFSLSADGRYLIYTAASEEEEAFINEFWLISTDEFSDPIKLQPTDVLFAEWVPQQPSTISYSTGEYRQIAPFWQALNNLWSMRIDPLTGDALNIEPILRESSGGLYGWWGTVFRWSPDGENLAWVRADSMGLVDFETGELNPLLTYPVFNTSQPWSWRASVSWSWDSQLIATTEHGQPLGSEPAENSPVFNVVVTDTNGSFQAKVLDSAGMWSAPKYSPDRINPLSQYPKGFLAYLRSREPYNSITGEYDLIVADRDGSNARVIFPQPDQPGITTQDFGLTAQDYVWDPTGTQIALIYRGNLWKVDVESGVAHQLTFDGGSSNPVWSR